MPDPRIFPIETATDGFVTVGAVSTLVLAANPYRVDVEFVNDSDPEAPEPIYLARGNAAAMGSGIALTTRGSSYRIGTNNLFKGAIYGICASQEVNLTISEGHNP